MGNNPSVKQLKTDFQDFAKNVATDFHTATLLMAGEVVDNIRSNAPRGGTGNLKASIRMQDVSTETKISVLVRGGGSLTTRRTKAGHSYDYAVATEFGTVKEAAEPFFYSTYRAYKAGGLEFFKETLDQTIAENNTVRGLRSSNTNYTTNTTTVLRSGVRLQSSTTRSVGYRGAVVIPSDE